jgi:hypothetical protein
MAFPSAHKLRLIDDAAIIAAGEDEREIAYHHTVFCQTALPSPSCTHEICLADIGPVALVHRAARAGDNGRSSAISSGLEEGTREFVVQNCQSTPLFTGYCRPMASKPQGAGGRLYCGGVKRQSGAFPVTRDRRPTHLPTR